MEKNKRVIGQRIKSIRQSKGMTLEEFGSLIDNSSKSNVSKWETGVSLPNNNRLKLIATLGRITVEELLYGDFKSYCHDIFNSIKDELMDNGYSTIHANTLMMMEDAGETQKIKNAFDQGYQTIQDLKLSYEDNEKIKDIFKNSIDLHFLDHEYTNEGAINFSIDYVRALYETEILDHFLYEVGNPNEIRFNNTFERENVNQEIYDEIRVIIDEAVSKLEKLKEKYSEN